MLMNQQDDIGSYATVAISKEEVTTGISRMITFPGGKQVLVPIPAGTRDGQVIRVAEFDETLDQSAVMMLNIAVKQTNEIPRVEAVSGVQSQPETPRSLEPISSHDLPTVAAPSTPNERIEQYAPQAPKNHSSLALALLVLCRFSRPYSLLAVRSMYLVALRQARIKTL